MVYLLAIASAVLYGAADFLGGLASRRASAILVVVFAQGSGLVAVLLLLPALPGAAPSMGDLAWGGAAGLAGGGGVALLYRALAVGTMAVVAPTTAVCAVLIPVAAATLGGERVPPLATAGIGLALLAIVLVSQERGAGTPGAPRGWRLPAGFPIALLSGVAIGLFFLALARVGVDAGLWPIASARAASVLLLGAIALIRPPAWSSVRPVASVAVAAGVMDMAANALYLVAARRAPLSVVVTLASLYPASTVLLARAVLGERLNAWQASGVVLALVAIALIVGGDTPWVSPL